MTVCIAAIADKEKAIITITDQMIGAGVLTADFPMALKASRLKGRWYAAFAGNDISHVPSILDRASETMGDAEDVAEIGRAFARAYQHERQRVAEETILSPFGLDMTQFVALLATDPNPEVTDLRRKIQELDFDPTFLVTGFDSRQRPHIFTVSPPGTVNSYDSVGFWSIGSGSEAALSNLFYRQYDSFEPWRTCMYQLAEAKYMSESAIGVGRNSVIHILHNDGKSAVLSHGLDDLLREIWEAEGKAPMPQNLEERLKEIVPPEAVTDLNEEDG